MMSHIITGPPTHSVGGQYCFACWRLSSVGVCSTPRQAYRRLRHAASSSTVTLHDGPVVFGRHFVYTENGAKGKKS